MFFAGQTNRRSGKGSVVSEVAESEERKERKEILKGQKVPASLENLSPQNNRLNWNGMQKLFLNLL